MVAVREAPDHAIGEFVRFLHRKGLRARVFLDPSSLLAHEGDDIRILRLRPDHAAITQPARPHFAGLRVVLWIANEIDFDVSHAMPDFLDWSSHSAICPWQVPWFAEASLEGALRLHGRVWWQQPERPSWWKVASSSWGPYQPEWRRYDVRCGDTIKIPLATPEGAIGVQRARAHARAFGEDKAELMYLRTNLPCPGWWRASESVGDLACGGPIGLDLTALTGLEPDLIEACTFLIARGHAPEALRHGELATSVPGLSIADAVLREAGVRPTEVFSSSEPLPGLIDEYGATQLALRLYGHQPTGRAWRADVIDAVGKAIASRSASSDVGLLEHAAWAPPPEVSDRISTLENILSRGRDEAIDLAEWVSRWPGWTRVAMAMRGLLAGDHPSMLAAFVRAPAEQIAAAGEIWLGVCGRRLRASREGLGEVDALTSSPSGTLWRALLTNLARHASCLAWRRGDRALLDRWLAVGLCFDDGSEDPILWMLAAHRERDQGRPGAAARALLRARNLAGAAHRSLLDASLRAILRRAGLIGDSIPDLERLTDADWQPDPSVVGPPLAIEVWLERAEADPQSMRALLNGQESQLSFCALATAEAFRRNRGEHARSLAEWGAQVDESLCRSEGVGIVESYPIDLPTLPPRQSRRDPEHIRRYKAVGTSRYPIFHEVLAVLDARAGKHTNAALRLLALRDGIAPRRRALWDATVLEQLSEGGVLDLERRDEPTIWREGWEPAPTSSLPPPDDAAARRLILELARQIVASPPPREGR